jgi:DUF971 family protein
MPTPYEMAGRPAPAEIRYRSAERLLEVDFADGRQASFTAEFLRVMSPSAEVQGHGPEQRIVVPGKRQVTITRIEPVGVYAVRLIFDDGHDTGLFSWDFFYSTMLQRDAMWVQYEQDLRERKLSRD